MSDLSLRVGGAAGDGIASIGEMLTRSFTRMGLHAVGLNAYQSVIRGGHVWFHARGSDERVWSTGDGCDLLYGMTPETIEIHGPTVRPGGAILYDPEKFVPDGKRIPEGVRRVEIPTLAIARKYTSQSILQNAAGTGALAALAGIPFEVLESTLTDAFGRKAGDVVQWNVGAARDGYEAALAKAPVHDRALSKKGPAKLLLTGNQAIALGAVAAGCKFLAQYPMTPASSIMHWLAAHAHRFGVVVKQAEDELAAINMAIGASFGGVRAMTATSGGGFSLMVEGLGMAGMTETPVVVVESQRAGPSTGLPTKTEQGDLWLMLGAGQGEFPRAILAPADPVEAYRLTIRAFQLAEEWQTPVLLAADFHLSETFFSAERDELPLVPPPGPLVSPPPNGEYRRYAYTPSGVSPRAFPGSPGLQFVAGSDEHDERGHLISDVKAGVPAAVEERKRMMDKRMAKLEGIRRAGEPPFLEGPPNADLTFVAWGSTVGPVRDAMRELGRAGIRTNLLRVPMVYPVPSGTADRLASAKRTLLVEANYSGQFGRLLRAETGIGPQRQLTKYDGEPFYPTEIVTAAREAMVHGGQ